MTFRLSLLKQTGIVFLIRWSLFVVSISIRSGPHTVITLCLKAFYLSKDSKIPSQIREQVLILWLRGYSRDDIARRIAIGAGTVSDIIKAYNQRNPELALLREYVVAVKKEGVSIKELASAIRLKRMLESHNLEEEQIESLLNKASIHCFKKGAGLEKFIENVDKASYLADTTGVAIEELPDHIQETKRELYCVTIDLMSKRAEREQALKECDETKALLNELKRKKVHTSEELRNLQEIKALGEDTLIRSLAWEKTCRGILAHGLAEWVLSQLTNPNKKNP